MNRLRAEDLFRIRLISTAEISPSGTRVCYARTEVVPDTNEYRSHLWMVGTYGEEPSNSPGAPIRMSLLPGLRTADRLPSFLTAVGPLRYG